MLVLGLTGGVATGKSTVARRLAELGALIIDADVIARQVVAPGEPALAEVRAAFGDAVFASDGTLDRPRLGQIVFASAERRQELERIIHPRVRARMKAELEEARRAHSAPVVVLDVPLLYETGVALELVDRVLVVYAAPGVQKERLMQRSHLSESEAEARIRAQMPTAAKAARADHVIDNSGSLAETYGAVDSLWKEWQSHCASR